MKLTGVGRDRSDAAGRQRYAWVLGLASGLLAGGGAWAQPIAPDTTVPAVAPEVTIPTASAPRFYGGTAQQANRP